MSIAHLGLADQPFPSGAQRPAAEGWQGERTPPHDLLAEQSAIGGMLLSGVGMIFAAAGLLSPVAGAVAQEAIDLVAVLNALRTARQPSELTDFDR